ncbi:hypothetical protein CIPAW_05G053900 [Carya illinoinensis]|uniref:Calmodulin-binding protein n=1 Tax=Carya illinoinensis TaxID=32201 RepID=A0A8T1QG17_CARIL|nr:hypothetical protein CIPAW_05G053900 [Carya illinoinensis]
MEVVVPVAPVDFNFDSSCSSPYMTAPSSPQRFGNFYFSAPTSPTRASAFYHEATNNGESDNDNDGGEDFEFDFSGHLERTSLSADELFDGGKIKPLKPPPRLQVGIGANDHSVSISSPRKDFDPFAAAIEETRKKGELDQRQGREQEQKSFLRRGTRSLSPLRVSDLVLASNTKASTPSSSSAYSSFLSSFSFSQGYRKWRLKDFLLFRSASEGRATGKDPLTKYAVLSKNKLAEDIKNSSFRSTDSSGSVSSSRRRGPVSAHEKHYTVNRAVSEEMRRKTFLPYKQGLLGCLGFNPGVHEVTKAFGSLTRG